MAAKTIVATKQSASVASRFISFSLKWGLMLWWLCRHRRFPIDSQFRIQALLAQNVVLFHANYSLDHSGRSLRQVDSDRPFEIAVVAFHGVIRLRHQIIKSIVPMPKNIGFVRFIVFFIFRTLACWVVKSGSRLHPECTEIERPPDQAAVTEPALFQRDLR